MDGPAHATESIDAKLLGVLLRPSISSALIAVTTGTFLIAYPYFSLHAGDFARENIIGLHEAYKRTQIGESADHIGAVLSQSSLLNNLLLFLMWGSVGLVVYLIVQSLLNGLKGADDVVHEFGYVHADWRKIVIATIWRAVVRLSALAAWWIIVRFAIFQLVPFTWSLAHLTAENELSLINWRNSLLAALACMLVLHMLTILLRLTLLRPRLFGSVIV
jgi:hypothetical protein